MRVIQVIPLFGTSSDSAADYFNRHQDEIGAITGNHLIVALPDTVLKGDNGDVYSETNKEKRYPGLTNADLPCLWVESQEGHLVLSLSTTKAEINKLLAVVTQAAKDSKTWAEFEQQLGQRLKKHLPGSGLAALNPLAILRESVQLVPAMRYALAVLGLIAVVAIAAAWRIDFKVAVFGALIIFGLMIPVLVFARMTTLPAGRFVAPAMVLMWVFVILTSIAGVFLLSAAAFRYPPDFARLIFGTSAVPDKPNAALITNINKIVEDWANFTPKTPSQIPAGFTALCEAILAEWPASAAVVSGQIDADSVQTMARAVDNYLSAMGDHEREIDWLGAVAAYHYNHSRREDLALTMQERQLQAIANTLRVTAAPAENFDELIARGFSVLTAISDLDPGRRSAPPILRSRMILHHKKAQSYARAHQGIWDPNELAAAFELAEKLMKDQNTLASENLDLITNILMRKLNDDADDPKKRPSALLQASRFLEYSKPAHLEGLQNLSMSTFAVAVNYAKLNEEHILFSVYGAYPVDAQFVDSAEISPADLGKFLQVLNERTITPLRQVKAFLSGREEWHHWANVTLDIARACGLAVELTRMTSGPQSIDAYVTQTVTELNELNRSPKVEQDLKKRLMTDIVNRPEYATVRKDERIKHLVAFYALEGR